MVLTSAADERDLTVVPEDDAELLAELRRHGVRPGQRKHVSVAHGKSEPSPTRESTPAFFASFGGDPGLAEQSDNILRTEFPELHRTTKVRRAKDT